MRNGSEFKNFFRNVILSSDKNCFCFWFDFIRYFIEIFVKFEVIVKAILGIPYYFGRGYVIHDCRHWLPDHKLNCYDDYPILQLYYQAKVRRRLSSTRISRVSSRG